MARRSRENPEIREFILQNIAVHPGNITAVATEKFKVARSTITGYLNRLVNAGLLVPSGVTSGRKYERKPIHEVQHNFSLSKNSSEDSIWRYRVLPYLGEQNPNVIELCQYGFTEIYNNCIDHSSSAAAQILVTVYYDEVQIRILDQGIGIFEKIRNHFNLVDARHALLELAKGKLTSDRKNHSGEGIFFTSRMFNRFNITSGHLYYAREMKFDDEWLIENHDTNYHVQGTQVLMAISSRATWTRREVFESYQASGNVSFRKTHVPIKLGKYPNEELVSRSQAKRILARVGDFSEVILDFEGIDEIGQAFADEIFRVFVDNNPEIHVIYVRTSSRVQTMIEYVRRAAEVAERNPLLPRETT